MYRLLLSMGRCVYGNKIYRWKLLGREGRGNVLVCDEMHKLFISVYATVNFSLYIKLNTRKSLESGKGNRPSKQLDI